MISNTLFTLLQSALGSLSKACSLSEVTSEQWKETIDLSFEQGVDAISVDGYHKCLENGVGGCLLESDEALAVLKYVRFGSVLQEEENYAEHTKVLEQLVTHLRKDSIKLLLLKGIGLSKYYPVPNHRPCGDIDIFTYGQDEKVNKIASALGCEVNQEHEKHSVFQYMGISIENHRLYLDSFQTKNEAKVQEFLYSLSDDILNEDGYYTPSPLKNYFFLLCHMSRHFSEYECITLRHLLDWGLFLNGERENLDLQLVQSKLKEFHLEQCNSIFTSLAQDVTGLDLSVFVTSSVDSAVKHRFMDTIMMPKHREEPARLIPRIAYKLKIVLGNQWKYKYLGITYRERILWSIKLHLLGKAEI